MSAAMRSVVGPESADDPLRRARVLVELGALRQAEAEVAELLERDPEHLDALALYAKIKHIRGELSLAIACEAQIHARRRNSGELARMHLESILHLTQDPERGAGEFLAVGGYQLAQKPTAYLALEEAFRLYLARKPNEARDVCRRVAAQYREGDREVHGLAIMAEAWIDELVGDFPAACQLLERLGQERGFETNVDRLVALVGLYERIGTRERIEAAINICLFLERTGAGRGTTGRLAALYRRLGDEERTREYDARHLEEYRYEMQRPTFADVVIAAAERHLPLDRLLRLKFSETSLPETIPPRARVLAEAMHGRRGTAEDLLAKSGDLLDLQYRADLVALDPDRTDEAAELYFRAFEADPGDADVLGWLLDHESRRHGRAIAQLVRDPARGPRALELLEAAARTSPGNPIHWRRLERFFALQPHGHEQAARFAERAAAVERSAIERSRPIGRVLAAATYRFVGGPHGLIHEVWCGRELASPGRGGTLRREDILGNVAESMRDSVRSTFMAVREYALARFPHAAPDVLDYNYSFKITKDDEPSGGTSAGLPTAIAFLSLFLQRPVPQDTAFTGVLVTDAHDVINVRPVGDIEHKVNAAYHRNLQTIIVPAGNRPALEQSRRVPLPVVQQVVLFAATLEDVTRLLFEDSALV